MERTGIRAEERTGLIVALALHLALLAVLVIRTFLPQPVVPVPERMTVSLAEDVGLSSTAPDAVPESRAAVAPTLSDSPAPAPVPDIMEAPSQPVPERPVTRQVQSPVPTPARTASAPRREPREAPRPKPAERTGGSRIGTDFLAGRGDSTTISETRTPASQIGASAKASIGQAVSRQIKPHWSPPSGPEVENIVTFVRFRLNEDGSLAGTPQVVRQTGINDTNRAQAQRHGEQAVRAVRLAAPFDLPPEYYEAWKTITANLDWRLAQ